MTRSRRIGSLVRIRSLQARLAETEVARARRDVEVQRQHLESAFDDLEARVLQASGSVDSVDRLLGHRQVLGGAVRRIDDRAAHLDLANESLDGVRATSIDAHRRRDAIERLHDRAVAADRADEARRTQTQLDEHVTVLHGRVRDGNEEIR